MPALLPRSAPRWLTDPAVNLLARLGVTPNMLTLAGVLGNIGAGVLAGYGEFLAAGAVLLAASSLDLLDGALARSTGRATPFGSVFDSVMDRVSEAAVLFGLLVYYTDRGDRTEALLIFVAVAGSILVSYVRARAEIIGLRLREGLFTRAERVILLGAGLIVDGTGILDVLTPVLWILAVLASATALQRLALVWLQTRERGHDDSP
jgi:CDP-diacylglycerol--glycerol-3-phosphate 3-phosphatidyltransferase